MINIAQDHSGPVGCRRTDDDVAAPEDLLNQCLRVTDALNFIEEKRLIEPGEDAPFAADAPCADDVELIFAEQDDMQNPDRDCQQNQNHSEMDDGRVHFPVVAEDSEDTSGDQCAEANAQCSSDRKPNGIPDVFDDEQELIALDPIQNFFIDLIVHGDLLVLSFALRRGQNMKKEDFQRGTPAQVDVMILQRPI